MTGDKFPALVWGMRRFCEIERCPELLRANEEANTLRALLAQALDYIPENTPLASESRTALD